MLTRALQQLKSTLDPQANDQQCQLADRRMTTFTASGGVTPGRDWDLGVSSGALSCSACTAAEFKHMGQSLAT